LVYIVFLSRHAYILIKTA